MYKLQTITHQSSSKINKRQAYLREVSECVCAVCGMRQRRFAIVKNGEIRRRGIDDEEEEDEEEEEEEEEQGNVAVYNI
jgi:Ran GTPase-activating protein (RanGAP) involved in mRNA processing and transport